MKQHPTFGNSPQGADRQGTPPNDNSVLKVGSNDQMRMWIGKWDVAEPEFERGDCVFVVRNNDTAIPGWRLGPCGRKLPTVCQRPVCSKGKEFNLWVFWNSC